MDRYTPLFNMVVEKITKKYPLWACQNCKRGNGFPSYSCPVHGRSEYVERLAARYIRVFGLEERYNDFMPSLRMHTANRLEERVKFHSYLCWHCLKGKNCFFHDTGGYVNQLAARYASIYGPVLFRRKVLGDE